MNDPLASRIRPTQLSDVVGQRHLLAPGRPLYNLIESGNIPNLIFYGPSGTGKTTVASIIAKKTNKALRRLNGTNASTKDIKEIVSELDTFETVNGVLLYLDEIQYFNKRQQQSLLEYIEDGRITLIASTTENPYFYIYPAVLSRSTVFEFKSVEWQDIIPAVRRGLDILSKENGVEADIDEDALKKIAVGCSGDVRKALNSAENCYFTAPIENGRRHITAQSAAELSQSSSVKYDREGDEHYDIISAYQKSLRGSDANAALHYLARLLEAGDLPSACRRLLVCAAEDVGLAYPQIIPIVKAAVDTALAVGLPEARIPLADAVILVASAPKSNSGVIAIDSALSDVRSGRYGAVPRALQNKHFDGEDAEVKGQFYLYPHEFENHWVEQQYLPDELKNAVYYKPGENKNEQSFAAYWQKIKKERK